jgi:mRNA-degrading endonuclease RelE of RelBE toxin-antitoxin system
MGRVTIDPPALLFLRTLAPGPKRAVRAAVDELRADARPKGVDWKRLETDAEVLLYRLRVGDYRVVYVLLGSDIRVVRVFHRREGYHWLERLGY